MLLAILPGRSWAQTALLPVGLWQGRFDDGSGIVVLLLNSDGTFCAQVSGGTPLAGYWTWQPSSLGGIVTLHYFNAGFHNKLYYSIVWTGPDTIILSDPWFHVALQLNGAALATNGLASA
jgi:hypothetical protein